MKTATFTHLLSGKPCTVFDPAKTVLALIHGSVEGQKDALPRVWLVLAQMPTPIAISETYEEALKKLELKGETNE